VAATFDVLKCFKEAVGEELVVVNADIVLVCLLLGHQLLVIRRVGKLVLKASGNHILFV